MLEFFTDTDEGNVSFAFYDADGDSKKAIKLIKETLGYVFESTEDNDIFDDLPEFLSNTLIIGIDNVNEDILELAKDKGFVIYIVP